MNLFFIYLLVYHNSVVDVVVVLCVCICLELCYVFDQFAVLTFVILTALTKFTSQVCLLLRWYWNVRCQYCYSAFSSL